MSVDLGASLLDQCNAILAETERQRRAERNLREVTPVVRLWDGEWNLIHLVTSEYSGSFELVDGDTGAGELPIPTDSRVAQWALDSQARIARGEKRNIHVTVDYVGARWSGRLKNVVQEDMNDGSSVTTLAFASDYEELKFYDVWSNPFLPAIVQFPRVFILPGPAIWVLKTTLFMQIFREHNPLITFPDDPMNFASWGNSLNQSNWNIVVKPTSFVQDMAAGTIWTVATSRWKNFHDMAKPIYQDAQITPVLRRWLTGDPAPWAGANLRHGALVVDFVDKSGVYSGTSNGGSIFDGLVRTFETFASDFIDTTSSLVTDTVIPSDYYVPGKKGTDKRLPYAVYLAGERSGIQSARWMETPSTAIQVNTGGHSAPGVNEAISAGIQALGDILGNLAQIGSIGGSIDTLLRPFYEDTLAAWMSVKSFARAQNSGWSRYFEYFQEGSGKAYTLSSLMVLRTGFWTTRTWTSHEINVRDGAPFLIGDNGSGDFFLGDRVGATRQHDASGRIYMDRVSKLVLSWSREAGPEWGITIGDDRALQDPAQRAWERIEQLLAAVKDLGAF